VIPAPVDYVRAGSVDEALEALGTADSRPLAGGQSLLPLMKLRVARPSLVVDIGRLDLAGLDVADGELRIGALTTWDELSRAPQLRAPALAAIGECAAGIGDLQVRNRGTIGGSLVHADPASDMPAVALALGSTLRLRSRVGERTVAADDFFQGPFLTVREEQELLTEVSVPRPPPDSGSAYCSVEHPASGFALAGAAALVTPRAGGAWDVSLALTGVAGRPLRVPVADAGEAERAIAELDMDNADDYRRQLATVVARRAIERALARARGEEPS
jgi:carbon-monoxide dehydrogenase medium subunit